MANTMIEEILAGYKNLDAAYELYDKGSIDGTAIKNALKEFRACVQSAAAKEDSGDGK